jgi:hypothetical protein
MKLRLIGKPHPRHTEVWNRVHVSRVESKFRSEISLFLERRNFLFGRTAYTDVKVTWDAPELTLNLLFSDDPLDFIDRGCARIPSGLGVVLAKIACQLPAAFSRCAVVIPVTPAPTTTTSTFMFLCSFGNF